jgi:hypothetical protein
MKRRLFFIAIGIGALCFAAGYFVTNESLRSFLIGLSTNFIAIGVGIVFINYYIESDSRKGAVTALFILTDESIANYHDSLLERGWSKFGQEKFSSILDEYTSAALDPSALSGDVRDFLYDLYKQPAFSKTVNDLDESLTELSRLSGWNLDADLLKYCLEARISVTRLKSLTLDDSSTTKTAVTEHLLDLNLKTSTARYILMRLAGIKEQ